MFEQSLLLIKPNAVNKRKIGSILKIVEDAGFQIEQIMMFEMGRELADDFYSAHRDKVFFSKLIDFMTSGKTVAVIVGKENAIEDLRNLVGDTEPAKADIGTVRQLFGDDVTANGVHASDSVENAVTETNKIFNKK